MALTEQLVKKVKRLAAKRPDIHRFHFLAVLKTHHIRYRLMSSSS